MKATAGAGAYRALISGGGAVLDGNRITDIDGLVELLTVETEEGRWLRIKDSEDKKAQAEALAAMINDLVANRR